MESFTTDILEDDIIALYGESVLERLLWCHSKKYHYADKKQIKADNYKNYHIVWATSDYATLGNGFESKDQIQIEKITGSYNTIIQPRAVKSEEVQRLRTQQKAEVFTPAWVCNSQNNLIDNAWFEAHGKSLRENGWFNLENLDNTWQTNCNKIFSEQDGNLWKEYVKDIRIEIACGEAPYLVTRYDAVTGHMIEPIINRVGLLDRKLRIVSENCQTTQEWIEWANIALKATYGFEYQGDNLLLAREALFLTVVRYFKEKFNDIKLELKTLEMWAYIISWNIFQMDGLTYKVPFTGGEVKNEDLFGGVTIQKIDDIPAYIRDWSKSTKTIEEFSKILPTPRRK